MEFADIDWDIQATDDGARAPTPDHVPEHSDEVPPNALTPEINGQVEEDAEPENEQARNNDAEEEEVEEEPAPVPVRKQQQQQPQPAPSPAAKSGPVPKPTQKVNPTASTAATASGPVPKPATKVPAVVKTAPTRPAPKPAKLKEPELKKCVREVVEEAKVESGQLIYKAGQKSSVQANHLRTVLKENVVYNIFSTTVGPVRVRLESTQVKDKPTTRRLYYSLIDTGDVDKTLKDAVIQRIVRDLSEEEIATSEAAKERAKVVLADLASDTMPEGYSEVIGEADKEETGEEVNENNEDHHSDEEKEKPKPKPKPKAPAAEKAKPKTTKDEKEDEKEDASEEPVKKKPAKPRAPKRKEPLSNATVVEDEAAPKRRQRAKSYDQMPPETRLKYDNVEKNFTQTAEIFSNSGAKFDEHLRVLNDRLCQGLTTVADGIKGVREMIGTVHTRQKSIAELIAVNKNMLEIISGGDTEEAPMAE